MTSYSGSFLDNIVIIKLMSWQIVNRWNQNYVPTERRRYHRYQSRTNEFHRQVNEKTKKL